MTVTDEQVADLKAGDVIELSEPDGEYPDVVVRGPLHEINGFLCLGDNVVRHANGSAFWGALRNLTFISRATPPAPPFYVNHTRTEPVDGDLARDAFDPSSTEVFFREDDDWYGKSGEYFTRSELPEQLRLLVDGDTGFTVTP